MYTSSSVEEMNSSSTLTGGRWEDNRKIKPHRNETKIYFINNAACMRFVDAVSTDLEGQ